MSNITKDLPANIIETANNFRRNVSGGTLAWMLTLVLLVIMIVYIVGKITLKATGCNTIDNIYGQGGPYNLIKQRHPLNSATALKDASGVSVGDHSIRDFSIMTAYNCCCTGKYKNDYVSLCALEACIKQGVRCLDFEIYSINNEPVVAASSMNDNSFKETYNYLEFTDILETINELAFSPSDVSNYEDPLFLNFRIRSNNCVIYAKMSDLIIKYFEEKLLGSQYLCQNDADISLSYNFSSTTINALMNKIIIMASLDDNNIVGYKLSDVNNVCFIPYTNAPPENTNNLYTDSDLTLSSNPDTFKNVNKK